MFGTTRVGVPHPVPGIVPASLFRLYVTSLFDGARMRKAFDHVRSYCMFVGYPRSGHSLLGSIIDAHPHAICSHELDALRLVETGFSRLQIYSLIARNSAEFAQHGRIWTFGYKYAVPGQWNGRFEKLLVVGDKKGGLSSKRFAERPQLLDTLMGRLGPDVKFLHVTRNPFDNIAAMNRRGMSLADAVEDYFGRADSVLSLSRRIDRRQILTISHEQMIGSPADIIRELCRFLGLEPLPGYVEACSGVINREPHRTRTEIEWNAALLRDVRDRARANPFLRDYSFE